MKFLRTPDDRAAYNDGWLGILAAFAIAWAVMLTVGFVSSLTMDAEALYRTYSPQQIAYLSETPFWSKAGRGLSVVGMLCGGVYLLLRRESAYIWFMASLFGLLAMMLDATLRSGFSVLGGMESGVNLAIIIVGLFLFWAAYSAKMDGQLKAESDHLEALAA